MSVASLSHDLYGFAIELRQLAYTMPGGQEDPLIRLSERMARHAQNQAAEVAPAPVLGVADEHHHAAAGRIARS